MISTFQKPFIPVYPISDKLKSLFLISSIVYPNSSFKLVLLIFHLLLPEFYIMYIPKRVTIETIAL